MNKDTTSQSHSTPLPASIQNALAAANETIEKYRFSKKTTSNYKTYIERGKKYASNSGPEVANVFDSITSITPVILRAFVSHKCNENGLSYKTAEGIRSAFKRYFQETFSCQGNHWTYDNDKWNGNPVFDRAFCDFMTSLKNRDGRERVSKKSLPMTYQGLSKLMQHLQDSKTIAQHGEGFCLFFQAFSATSFTLWTRYIRNLPIALSFVASPPNCRLNDCIS